MQSCEPTMAGMLVLCEMRIDVWLSRHCHQTQQNRRFSADQSTDRTTTEPLIRPVYRSSKYMIHCHSILYLTTRLKIGRRCFSCNLCAYLHCVSCLSLLSLNNFIISDWLRHFYSLLDYMSHTFACSHQGDQSRCSTSVQMKHGHRHFPVPSSVR